MKFTPVMITDVPGAALIGVKELIEGIGGRTVNTLVARDAVVVKPSTLIKLIIPEDVPEATTPLLILSFTTVIPVNVTEPMATPDVVFTSVKLLPVIVSTEPIAPKVGEKPVISGAFKLRITATEALAY